MYLHEMELALAYSASLCVEVAASLRVHSIGGPARVRGMDDNNLPYYTFKNNVMLQSLAMPLLQQQY